MASFVLRVEGVNLSGFVYDTQDLSTIRGGGLLLLNAADQVAVFLTDMGCHVDSIVKASSIGLFNVTSTKTAASVRTKVEERLAAWLPHATFVVDVAEESVSFQQQRDLVWARNRIRQMQAPSVVYPALAGLDDVHSEVCGIDMVGPATNEVSLANDKKQFQSASVYCRREHGSTKEKQGFYKKEMARSEPLDPAIEDLKYSNDFNELCGDSKQWGNLRDKMAIIHLDGNGVGQRMKDLETPEETREFSNGLRNAQARILRQLVVQKIADDENWEGTRKPGVRLETLLWGGDEVTWVVPAWKAWDALQFFFSHFEFRVAPPLTFTAALVFCHQKSPIATITHLAKSMVDTLKDAHKDTPDNRFLYQVLESFDHIKKPDVTLQLPKSAMSLLSLGMPQIREHVPRRKVYRMLKKPGEANLIFSEITGALSAAGADDAQRAIEALGDSAWAHISELWDYVVPQRRDS